MIEDPLGIMSAFRRRSSTQKPNPLVSVLRRLSPHRPTASDDKANEENDSGELKGPLGLNQLVDVPEAQIDFVFIHGLGGGSRKTWAANADSESYWPKFWLPHHPSFEHVRIYSFGYAADWEQRKESLLNIRDFARSLVNAMYCDPKIGRGQTKIVLVAHSLGGIVAKKAFMSAKEDSDFREIANRIHTIYFLATPHRGADLAQTLDSILRLSYPKTYVPELRRNSETIASINDSFRHIGKDLNLWSFYESQKTTIAKAVSILIVDEASATLGYEKEKPVPLEADHRRICKFENPNDHNYVTLRNNFVRTIEDILAEVSRSSSERSDHEHRLLADLTGFSETPIDDLQCIESNRTPGTCGWLPLTVPYRAWVDFQTRNKSIFWLIGNAGSGKSYLSSYVIKEMKTHDLNCSFFFFKKGVMARSTISECLRSLAYQMAVNDKMVLSKLVQFSISAEHWDEKTIWRKLFVECIFTTLNTSIHVWVIDALDECQKYSVLVNFLAQTPPGLKVFITTRTSEDTMRLIERMDFRSLYYQIQHSDTLNDFGTFIRSRIDRVPLVEEERRRSLEVKILTKASGSFLWVSLIIQKLEQAYSEEEVEEILEEVPSDMNELYGKILEELVKNPRALKLARCIFSWTVLSLRPLKIQELMLCIKLDAKHTIFQLEKVIAGICGQLVQINNKGEAEIIHETAKSYLSHQSTYPQLTLRNPDDHTRIAQICLETLVENFRYGSQVSHLVVTPSRSTQEYALLDYAAEFFSEHLQRSSSTDDSPWHLLCRFLLRSSVLAWIEYSATKNALPIVLRTAKNLRSYLKRRIKYLQPLDPNREGMAALISDLAKVSTKFGTFLATSPVSIHTLIPAICPLESSISKTIEVDRTRLVVRGHKDSIWEDCLVRIEYPTSQTSALAFGDQHSAVGMNDGSIYLYHHESNHIHHILEHDERVMLLAFSTADQYLASSGRRKLKIWDPAQHAQLWSFDTDHQALSLMFYPENNGLVAAMQGNYTNTWLFGDECNTRRWSWVESIPDISGIHIPNQQPTKAVFTIEHSILAVTYRGLPIYLFNMRTATFMGCCTRENGERPTMAMNQYSIDALVFNSDPEINVLISSYGDGELVLYDIESRQLRFRSQDIFAHSLAVSHDCRILLTGSSRGTIQIFEFGGARGDKISLIYRINAYDDGIRAVAFSNDGLRFADIRAAQFRIWEPELLITNDTDEGSQSDLSQATTLVTKSTSMLEGPVEPNITSICRHTEGSMVFAGMEDGSVVWFDSHSAKGKHIIYQHVTNTRVTAIEFAEKTSTLMTADESGRILINSVTISGPICTFNKQVAHLRVQDSVSALLSNTFGSSFIARGQHSLFSFTVKGEPIASPISFFAQEDMIVINHPILTDYFLTVDYHQVVFYSWSDLSIGRSSLPQSALPSINITRHDPSDTSNSVQTSRTFSQVCQSSEIVVYFSKPLNPTAKARATLFIRRVKDLTPALSSDVGNYLNYIDIPDRPLHLHKFRQIISVSEHTLFFLDTSFWICSLDTRHVDPWALGTRRHFFLLPEWQCEDGSFIIEYLEDKKEFLVARQSGIIVFENGLEFSEPWITRQGGTLES